MMRSHRWRLKSAVPRFRGLSDADVVCYGLVSRRGHTSRSIRDWLGWHYCTDSEGPHDSGGFSAVTRKTVPPISANLCLDS